MLFNASEWARYSRHIQLPQLGAAGQTRLKQSHVLIVGAGGLGSPVSLYLAAAGVGKITIIDHDHIDLSNLQRQILFTTEQVGQSKALCAQARLLALNPDIDVKAITEQFSTANAQQLIQQADLILDCTDNFTARYLMNDTCLAENKPWLFASIFQFSGQCALFTPDTACFRCLFPEHPDNIEDCNTAGVVGVLPGLLGTLQTNEAIKYLTGLDCPLENHLMLVEAIDLSFKRIKLAKNTECDSCSTHATPTLPLSDQQCDADIVTTHQISIKAFEQATINQQTITVDVRSIAERAAFHIGGRHIPLDQLADQLHELDKNMHIICYCQSGIRSQEAAALLQQSGYKSKSLHGGLNAYTKSAYSKHTTTDAV